MQKAHLPYPKPQIECVTGQLASGRDAEPQAGGGKDRDAYGFIGLPKSRRLTLHVRRCPGGHLKYTTHTQDFEGRPSVAAFYVTISPMTDDPQSFLAAHSRYQGYRDAAFDLTWDEFHRQVPIECDLRVMPIDKEALSFWQAIRTYGLAHPSGGFPWSDIFWQVRSTPRRFDVSIWDGPALCGLAVGMASRGDENVTLRWIERFSAGPDALRGFVAEIALTAADHYAAMLGKRLLFIKQPLTGTEAVYQALGFSLASRRCGGIYYGRAVRSPG